MQGKFNLLKESVTMENVVDLFNPLFITQSMPGDNGCKVLSTSCSLHTLLTYHSSKFKIIKESSTLGMCPFLKYCYRDNSNALPVMKMCKPSNHIRTTFEYQTKLHEVKSLSNENQALLIWKFPDH